MKRILVLAVALMLTATAFSQKNITQFMGIPVDGTKSAMIQKLKAKGFTYNTSGDYLEGQFNGSDVYLYVGTNNNKVYRIMVADKNGQSVGNIRIRFNRLCSQFENNGKYVSSDFGGEYALSDDEDISYEMSVHDKRYQASYYQISEEDKSDTTGLSDYLTSRVLEDYGEEKWGSMSEEEQQNALLAMAIEHRLERISHKSVWFMIDKRHGEYRIFMYYDNKLNQANGEDL
ncbi:MAG: hypothetical protein IJV22_10295 [Bacteroidales bacterium]|nr:hypothetical protein [Bacteroidales bacterium]MBQ9639927.1 hypothetical protein [Bacteroidales bacterium]